MSTIFICFFGFAVSAVWSASPAPYRIEDAEYHFQEFIKKYGKKYESVNEEQYRFEIFVKNLELVNKLNEKSDHAVHGITKFLDLTAEEFTSIYTGLKSVSDYEFGCTFARDSGIPCEDAPESYDWRDRGVVTSVKDQGRCGSCFAFSAVGNLEGQYAIKYKKLVDLSAQQIVDCDYLSQGCMGGFMSLALRSVLDVGGIETEADYPYKAENSDDCYFEKAKAKLTIATCYGYNLTSQERLKQLLYVTGPISIGIQGSGLQTYTSGIISDEQCNKGEMNHGVLLVGYGVEKNKPYWIIKNSWGENWGEKGYFRVARGENAKSCDMLNPHMCSAVVD